MGKSDDWAEYYDVAGKGEPRETLLLALELFDSEPDPVGGRFAIDLGCGEGRDTVELLRRGWRVLAIDGEPEAIGRLRARPGLAENDRLETAISPFEELDWRAAALVSSSYALPFCPPGAFPAVWERLVASIVPGGRFCGQLFGDRDEWASDPALSVHSRAEAESLLEPFELERFDEVEEDGSTAVGDPKHWHLFHVVARKHWPLTSI
ncbi:MAG TPA: class I SAM-dependent methyltransferase [Gaiellaceae bacterium]|nr:class I SAM-dependent methyltransferase [Gaiellaceae bacterium]